MNESVSNIKIEGARLIFKNFRGEGSNFNQEGTRTCGVLLDDELAKDLEDDGWNVKYLKPREDSDNPEYRQPWLPFKIKYGKVSPIAVLITNRGKIPLDEETIEQLDYVKAENIDLIIRPYLYPASVTHEAGIAAYLKCIYVTVQEDDLEEKYGNIPWVDEV